MIVGWQIDRGTYRYEHHLQRWNAPDRTSNNRKCSSSLKSVIEVKFCHRLRFRRLINPPKSPCSMLTFPAQLGKSSIIQANDVDENDDSDVDWWYSQAPQIGFCQMNDSRLVVTEDNLLNKHTSSRDKSGALFVVDPRGESLVDGVVNGRKQITLIRSRHTPPPWNALRQIERARWDCVSGSSRGSVWGRTLTWLGAGGVHYANVTWGIGTFIWAMTMEG